MEAGPKMRARFLGRSAILWERRRRGLITSRNEGLSRGAGGSEKGREALSVMGESG